jgi:DNA-binding NarL/FixJ family response regulator
MWARRASAAGTVMSFFGEGSMGVRRLHETAGEGSAVDGFACLAQDGEGHALTVAGLSRARVRYAPRIGAIWRRVGLHVVAGWRLRRHLALAANAPEALVTPGGKVVDARGDAADDASLRRRIVNAAKSIDRARTRAMRADPEAALDLWQGLVAGRWSLVDHWESDGKRYLAALRNEPSVPDPRALSPRERAVVHYAWLAASNKEIAFVLGLSIDAVASALSSALRKLGFARRSDLAALGDPKQWQTTRIEAGGQELELVETNAQPKPSALAPLTPAERAIAKLVLEGKTNEAIAKARRTSRNTVVNQLRAIYEKLGVRSRSELVRALV